MGCGISNETLVASHVGSFKLVLARDPSKALAKAHQFDINDTWCKYGAWMNLTDVRGAATFCFAADHEHLSLEADRYLGLEITCDQRVEGGSCMLIRFQNQPEGRSGRAWTINPEGTLSPKWNKGLVLGFGRITYDSWRRRGVSHDSMGPPGQNGIMLVAPTSPDRLILHTTSSQMVLTKRGAANQCVFAEASKLKAGEKAPLTLKSHPGYGIGKKSLGEHRAGPWRYILSGCGPAELALSVKYEDGAYLMLDGDDLVFDVSFWKMEVGNTVNFVGGTTAKEKTKQGGGGRDWTINDDGTISAKHHPHLVLGVQVPGKRGSSETAAPAAAATSGAPLLSTIPGVDGKCSASESRVGWVPDWAFNGHTRKIAGSDLRRWFPNDMRAKPPSDQPGGGFKVWHTNGTVPQWLQFDFTSGPKSVVAYELRNWLGPVQADSPSSFRLLAGSEGNWVELDRRVNVTWTGQEGEVKRFEIASKLGSKGYKAFRLQVDDVQGRGGPTQKYIALADLRLYGETASEEASGAKLVLGGGGSHDAAAGASKTAGEAPARGMADMATSLRMVLTKRGAANQCVFAEASKLKAGGKASLTLKSHPGQGIGKKYLGERRAGPWRYIESGCGPAEVAVSVKYEDGAYLMLDGDDLVFDVAFWKMEVGNAVNFVGGTTAKEKTKQGGGGRDWTINDDGTISAKHHPHLVLGVETRAMADMATSLHMVLTKRGAANQCVFAEASKLKAGGKASLTLKSHPGQGIGKKYLGERRAGPWRYIESGCGPAEVAVSVKYEDGAYLMLDGDDLVFDVSHWKMEVGNTVNFVGGTTAKEKTKQGGGGRDWTINDDGTISAKHHPHLVLGVQVPGMILVKRDSAERCVFEEAAKLKAGATVRLTLKSHQRHGIGKKYLDERRAGPWRYIESQVCRGPQAVSVRYEDGTYLMLDGDDLVFDVAHWKMEVGNAVNFVGGTTAKEKTKQGGGGRDWTINDDGTISAKHHPHLVLGMKQYSFPEEGSSQTVNKGSGGELTTTAPAAPAEPDERTASNDVGKAAAASSLEDVADDTWPALLGTFERLQEAETADHIIDVLRDIFKLVSTYSSLRSDEYKTEFVQAATEKRKKDELAWTKDVQEEFSNAVTAFASS